MESRKALPVGIEDFNEILNSDYYYVDKSGLIHDILSDRAKVTLFTRPRRFGKSLNMGMLKSFFEIGADEKLFDGLAIREDKKLCDEYMGRYPVISISLKSVDGSSYDDAYSMCSRIIKAEAMRHIYLLESPKLNSYEKRDFEKLLSGTYTEDEQRNSLWLLSSLLSKHYGRRVIILIDEYDVPLDKAYSHGYYDRMVILIRNLFERTLKTNENLQFAILTGCLRIAKESIFTGLNNLEVQSISSVKYDEYFGFTENEVKGMLEYYGFGHKHETVRKWYDGYKFGNESVYCPWDVINYISDLLAEPDLHPQNYWANTSNNDIIRIFLDKATATTRDEIEELVAGKTVMKKISEELTYSELDKTIDNLWSVLYTTGYLTRVNHRQDSTDNILALEIPNEEIRSVFKEKILSWFKDEAGNDSERCTSFCQAFMDGKPEVIRKMFDDYQDDMISIRDTAGRNNMKENFYHGFLLGILNFRTDWIVKSQREGGLGYNDILIMHKKAHLGMIIEVKYAESDNLEAECMDGQRQIDENHYTDALREYEPEKVYKYAIACRKKHCMVTLEEETRHYCRTVRRRLS